MRLSLHLLATALLSAALPAAGAADDLLAFPDAQGAAARTPGGRGGKILRVTTLASSGPGSLLAALEADGPRIVVFEVGGVIDFAQREIKITKPHLTVAGQTAPSPGVTLIRTGIDVATHDVVLQHIRVRTGSADAPKRGGFEPDAFSTQGAHDVIVDHCSMTWGIDENLSASGPRFTGKTPEDWRRGASYRVTFSNNIIAEGLRYSTHAKGEHSKGSLIHDNASDILIVGNLYAHNHERNPLFKGGVRGMVLNNLIYNPGRRWSATSCAAAHRRRPDSRCSCSAARATSSCTTTTTSRWIGSDGRWKSSVVTLLQARGSYPSRDLRCHSTSSCCAQRTCRMQ
jgi:hypothetical protein